MSSTTVITRNPARVVGVSDQGEELEKTLKEGEKVLDKCDCGNREKAEFARQVQRARRLDDIVYRIA